MLFLTKLMTTGPLLVSILLGLFLWLARGEVEDMTLKLETQTSLIALKQTELDTITATNRSLDQTITTLKHQLIEHQQLAQQLRQYNASIDRELQQTISELENLTRDKPVTNACQLSFSDAEYDRMQQFYRDTSRTSDLPEQRSADVSTSGLAPRPSDANQRALTQGD
ncbi:hypothetical protein [Vibrio mediterranei]|nr:hypothetical protein [Vibrio mediterranei]